MTCEMYSKDEVEVVVVSDKDKLPDNLVKLDHIRINRSIDKVCTCNNRQYILDTTNRRVNCSSCGAVIDPYDAMYELSKKSDSLFKSVEKLLEQRKQIIDYKPWLVSIRNFERKYRGKRKLPLCPRCDEPFHIEEVHSWTGREIGEARIKRIKEKDDKND